ncbi:hypothetical protein [Nocardiopsis composta]
MPMGPSPLFSILLAALALLLLAAAGTVLLRVRRSRRTAPPSPRTTTAEAPPSGLGPDDPARVGPYRIRARLGGGGMGQVFLGRSPGGHAVAVNVVRPDLARDPDFRRRFTAEVAAARKVGGFYTAQVVDADTDTTPPWPATAYIPGPPAPRRHRARPPPAGVGGRARRRPGRPGGGAPLPRARLTGTRPGDGRGHRARTARPAEGPGRPSPQ